MRKVGLRGIFSAQQVGFVTGIGIFALYLRSFFKRIMAEANKYELITMACRSRLLFRTEAEYREALGVSLETVANNRASARSMDMYFGMLAKAAEETADFPLEDFVKAYAEASELYLGLDWGDRTQMASRKRLCRMLFRLYATGGKSLSADEILKFKIKDDDERLLRVFFPDGPDQEPAVDVKLVTLFAFGVARPYVPGSRVRDISDKDTTESLQRLRGLIEVLKADMPRLGSTEKPLALDEWLGLIDDSLADPDELAERTPLWMSTALADISRACLSLVEAERLRAHGEQFGSLHLYGIWVDDADQGKGRFWVFPDNCMMAFCYERDGAAWRLSPYEFRVQVPDSDDCYASFILLAPAGNLRFMLTPSQAIASDLMAWGMMDCSIDEATGEISGLEFIDGPCGLPDWFGWKSWTRLDRADARHERFRSALHDIYDPHSPSSMLLDNVAPELTDCYNDLAARDGKYIYVYDWQPRRCVMRQTQEDVYEYVLAPGEELPSGALFELEISEEHPLYAIPRSVERRGGGWELERFVKMLSDAENIPEAFIVHSSRVRHPRLVFPAYGVTIALDMDALAPLGVKKFTRRIL